jgi:hypothetical protein
MVMMHIFAWLQAGIELVTILVALNDEPVNLNLLDNIDCSASVFQNAEENVVGLVSHAVALAGRHYRMLRK